MDQHPHQRHTPRADFDSMFDNVPPGDTRGAVLRAIGAATASSLLPGIRPEPEHLIRYAALYVDLADALVRWLEADRSTTEPEPEPDPFPIITTYASGRVGVVNADGSWALFRAGVASSITEAQASCDAAADPEAAPEPESEAIYPEAIYPDATHLGHPWNDPGHGPRGHMTRLYLSGRFARVTPVMGRTEWNVWFSASAESVGADPLAGGTCEDVGHGMLLADIAEQRILDAAGSK